MFNLVYTTNYVLNINNLKFLTATCIILCKLLQKTQCILGENNTV